MIFLLKIIYCLFNTTFYIMNQRKINDLYGRIFNETVSAMSCLTLYLGHRLNLFQSIFEAGPITSMELSKKTDIPKDIYVNG